MYLNPHIIGKLEISSKLKNLVMQERNTCRGSKITLSDSAMRESSEGINQSLTVYSFFPHLNIDMSLREK